MSQEEVAIEEAEAEELKEAEAKLLTPPPSSPAKSTARLPIVRVRKTRKATTKKPTKRRAPKKAVKSNALLDEFVEQTGLKKRRKTYSRKSKDDDGDSCARGGMVLGILAGAALGGAIFARRLQKQAEEEATKKAAVDSGVASPIVDANQCPVIDDDMESWFGGYPGVGKEVLSQLDYATPGMEEFMAGNPCEDDPFEPSGKRL